MASGHPVIACGRTIQGLISPRLGAKRQSGKMSINSPCNRMWANRPGGKPSRGRKVHDWGRNVKVVKCP